MNRKSAERRAAEWLVHWEINWKHRTGTPGDHEGADWIAEQVCGSSLRMPSGSSVSHETFLLDRLDPGDTPCRRDALPRLVSNSVRTPATARNVVVMSKGTDPARKLVVVMTPRSSWWQATSERGGGIVCWLETLRALLASPPACDVVLTANSGHELGHLGLNHFFHRRSGWDQPGGATWVKYGSNIGASDGELSVISTDGKMRASMRDALAIVGRPPDVMAPMTLVPNGETRHIHMAGGRYVTRGGTNFRHHLRNDVWPHCVDLDAITRIADGTARMVVDLTR